MDMKYSLNGGQWCFPHLWAQEHQGRERSKRKWRDGKKLGLNSNRNYLHQVTSSNQVHNKYQQSEVTGVLQRFCLINILYCEWSNFTAVDKLLLLFLPHFLAPPNQNCEALQKLTISKWVSEWARVCMRGRERERDRDRDTEKLNYHALVIIRIIIWVTANSCRCCWWRHNRFFLNTVCWVRNLRLHCVWSVWRSSCCRGGDRVSRSRISCHWLMRISVTDVRISRLWISRWHR